MTYKETIEKMKDYVKSENWNALEKEFHVIKSKTIGLENIKKIQSEMLNTPPHRNQWNLFCTLYPELAQAIQDLTGNFYVGKKI